MKSIPFEKLAKADLVIDATYEGNREDKKSSYGSEPIHHIFPGVGNAGGFRKRLGLLDNLVCMILTSTGSEPDWPDELDPFTGTYTYYGDNRKPGQELHDTHAKGNADLNRIFALAHGSKSDRSQVPLILIFHSGEKGRDVVFKGLAVPGTNYLTQGEDLIAIWRMSGGKRFQNYRASFTILDTGTISGEWVRGVLNSRVLDLNDSRAPKALLQWVNHGKYVPLVSERVRTIRTIKEQLPQSKIDLELINSILNHCKNDPFLFEPIAAAIWQLSTLQPMEYELTRRVRDGGRDAIGFLKIGPLVDPIKISFALEAKCYSLTNHVGVKETSRLISRIKQREFGVLVTTSAVNKTAFEEIRDDGHPIVIISGQDIAAILLKSGINSAAKCVSWIESL